MRTTLSLLLAAATIAAPAHGQVDISADLEPIRLARNMPGLSAMAIKEGRIVAQGAAGFRRQGQTSPLLVTDRINIASCTKWMTATVAGRLVDRGLIGWNTRVRDLFPNYASFHPSFHDATLDQFLAHRTGLQQSSTFNTNHGAQYGSMTGTVSTLRRWVVDTVLTDAPEVTPGTYLYSNQGYAVAAVMLALASGREWDAWIADEIFAPARMSSASLGIVYDNALPPKAPVGHDLADGQTVPVARAAGSAASLTRSQASLGPGGYVACTLQDWAKFLHLHMTSDLSDYLAPATATRLQQPFTGTTGYSRGIFAVSRSWATPGMALNHSGDIFGHDTVVWMAPARDFIAVVFTNCRSADNRTALALDDVAGLLVSRYAGAAASGPLIEPPAFSAVQRQSGACYFDYFTLPGVRYAVESSPDLATWTPAGPPTGAIATRLVTRHTDSSPGSRKFYRSLWTP